MKHTLMACILGIALLTPGLSARAADAAGAPATSAAARKERAKQMPFRGKLAEIDTTARTITLSGKEKQRRMLVTTASRINKDGKPITLGELCTGESVGGLARANANGEWEIVTLNTGKKATSPPRNGKGEEDPPME